MSKRFNGAAQIAELREQGYGVSVTHQRLYLSDPTAGDKINKIIHTGWRLVSLPKRKYGYLYADFEIPETTERPSLFGGRTVVTIFDSPEFELKLCEGVATCRPDERFNREHGLTVAAGRAAKLIRSTAAV